MRVARIARRLRKLGREGVRRNNRAFKLYYLLSNPIYVGKVRHRKSIYGGEHEAIIDGELFDQVQSLLEAQGPDRRSRTNGAGHHLLTGILFDHSGNRLGPVFTTNHGNDIATMSGRKVPTALRSGGSRPDNLKRS